MRNHEQRSSAERTPGARSTGRRRALGAVAASVLVVGAAACADDDGDGTPVDEAEETVEDAATSLADAGEEAVDPIDSTIDEAGSVDTVEDAVDEAGSVDTGEDAIDEAMTDDTTQDAADDTVEATGADVLTDTLAGEGVDLFLTLLPLVGLDELTEADEITVFVPSDEAFQSIEADEVAAIVEDPEMVRDVLESHVVEGAFPSRELNDGDVVTPVSGEELTVAVDGDTVMVGTATVLTADIEFDGGVIHVIDDVLQLPDA